MITVKHFIPPDEKHFCYVVDTIVAIGDAIGTAAGGSAAAGAGAAAATGAEAGLTSGLAAGLGGTAAELGAATIPEVAITAPALGAGVGAGELAAGGAGLGLGASALSGTGGTPGTSEVGGISGIPSSLGTPSTAASTSAGSTGLPSGIGSVGNIAAPAGGPGGGAASISAPASIGPTAAGGDVTQAIGGGGGPLDIGGASGIPAGASNAPSLTSGTFDSASGASGATTGGGSAGGAGAASGSNSILNAIQNPSLGAIGTALSKNSSTLLPALGLGYEAIAGQQQPKGYNQIAQTASQLGSQASQLEGYLQSGTLPPGIQSGITQAVSAAQAAIKSRYAAMGASGSSAEQQDLAAAQTTGVTQGANIAMQLLQQGVSEAGISSQLYQTIMNTSISQDQALGQAISSFGMASALSGLGGK